MGWRRGSGDFTVNVALIEGGTPILGVVGIPVTGALYKACRGTGAFKEEGGKATPLSTRPLPEIGAVLLASRSHGSGREAALTEKLPKCRVEHRGSS